MVANIFIFSISYEAPKPFLLAPPLRQATCHTDGAIIEIEEKDDKDIEFSYHYSSSDSNDELN